LGAVYFDGELEVTTCVWIFGRGASIDCGLNWVVPCGLRFLPRDWQIQWIKSAIRRAKKSTTVDKQSYKNLLKLLEARTPTDSSHFFVTTNWDYLLDTEISNLSLQVKPKWLNNSHVFHLNGSAEEWGDPKRRSEFYLESDSVAQRKWSLEANRALTTMIGQKLSVGCGL
jgi:hypothetical protein